MNYNIVEISSPTKDVFYVNEKKELVLQPSYTPLGKGPIVICKHEDRLSTYDYFLQMGLNFLVSRETSVLITHNNLFIEIKEHLGQYVVSISNDAKNYVILHVESEAYYATVWLLRQLTLGFIPQIENAFEQYQKEFDEQLTKELKSSCQY